MYKVTFEAVFNTEKDYLSALNSMKTYTWLENEAEAIFKDENFTNNLTMKEATGKVVIFINSNYAEDFENTYGKLREFSGYRDFFGDYKYIKKECFTVSHYYRVPIYEKESSEFKTLLKNNFQKGTTRVCELYTTNDDEFFYAKDITAEYDKKYSRVNLQDYIEELFKKENEYFTDDNLEKELKVLKGSIMNKKDSTTAIDAYSRNAENISKKLELNQMVKLFELLSSKIPYRDYINSNDICWNAASCKAYIGHLKYALELDDEMAESLYKQLEKIKEIGAREVFEGFLTANDGRYAAFRINEFLNHNNFDIDGHLIFKKLEFDSCTIDDIIERALLLFSISRTLIYCQEFTRNGMLRIAIYTAMHFLSYKEMSEDEYKEAIQKVSKTIGRIIGLNNIGGVILGNVNYSGTYFLSDVSVRCELENRKYKDENGNKILSKSGRPIAVDIIACVAEGDNRRGTKAFETLLDCVSGRDIYNDFYTITYRDYVNTNITDSIKYFNLSKFRKASFNHKLK